MRTVFSNSQCMHVYSQQTQEFGRGSSVSFRGAVFYDRSTPVARIVKAKRNRVNLITCVSYSVTTNQHLSELNRSMPSGLTFRVPSLGMSSSEGRYHRSPKEQDAKPDHRVNLAYLVNEYVEMRSAARKAVTYWEWRLSRMEELAATARLYASTFGLKDPDIDTVYDTQKERGLRAAKAAHDADPAVMLKRQQKADKAEARRERNNVRIAYGPRAHGYSWHARNVADRWLREAMSVDQQQQSSEREKAHTFEGLLKRYSQNAYMPQHEREQVESWLSESAMSSEQMEQSDEREAYVQMVFTAHRMNRDHDWQVEQQKSEEQRRADWLAGKAGSRHYGDTLLRVKPSDPSIVETSRGAEVPYDAARRLWEFIGTVEFAWSGRVRVGDFTLTSIDTGGNVTIGCHYITAQEIDRFANTQRWHKVAQSEEV